MEKPFKNISESEFEKIFSSEEACLSYLADLKWKKGYVCKKCGHTNYCGGKTPFSRRCTKCKHDESPKVSTLFEGCRFPLPKAFYIAYNVCNAKQISTQEMSKKLDLRQMTCWSFKSKLLECVSHQTEMSGEQKIQIEKLILQL